MDATVEQLLANLEQNPLDVAAIDALRAACERTGDFGPLLQALEAQARALAENEGDPHELGQLHCEIGNLWRDRMNRPDRAVAHYRIAIDFDAAQRPAMQAARALFAQAGKWESVAKLLTREAESMPAGAKKAGLLAELGRVYRDHLKNVESAAAAMREAVEADAEDLQAQHDLATLLLDAADEDIDAARAEKRRREAAEILCTMASGVGDDYAFAYVEAALDAVPDHATGIRMLEQLAPRVGRADTIPPRWVAGLQVSPGGPIARDLRLKLAQAYVDVGQLDDARVCLEPLTAEADAEALQILKTLSKRASEASLSTTTTEMSLDDAEPLELEPDQEERITAPADELAAMAARDLLQSQERGAEPLADLSSFPAGATKVEIPHLPSGELSMLADDEDALHRDALPIQDRDIHGELTQPRGHRAELEDEEDEDDAGDEHDATPQVGVSTDILRASERPPAKESARASVAPASEKVLRPESEPDLEPDPLPNQAKNAEVAKRRADLERKQRYRDLRGAADIAEQILTDIPTDAQAIAAIEDYCRATRDFRRSRALALRIAGEPAFPVDVRIERLREAGMLSESKLGDVEGTIAAWRDLYALSPADEEARSKLYKLLTRNQRWDELAQMLDREAMAATSSSERARRYREIGALHRDKRENLDDAIEAFSNARDLDSNDGVDDEALSELLFRAERFTEATTYFEARLLRAEGPEKLTLLRTLAEIYETKLGDVERAYEVNEQILKLGAAEGAELDRRERIDERLGRYDFVLATLQLRLDQTRSAGERVELLLRIAELCGDKLADRDRELSSLREALMLAPQNMHVLERAERAFDEADFAEQFTRLLSEIRAESTDKTQQMSLLHRIAKRLAKEGDVDAAIAAHQELLRETNDVETRRTLVGLLERKPERAVELVRELDLLANQVGREEAKVLRLSRAELLRDTLKDAKAAADELERVAHELAPEDVAVLERLAEVAAETPDLSRVASAKQKQLALIKDPDKRAALAEELSALFEDELKDEDGAVIALNAWADAAPADPRPYLRLLPLLERRNDHAALVKTLDSLAGLAVADDEVSDYLLRAARIASEQLQDHEGAWRRLVPRVVDHADAAAEEALREVAHVSGRGRELAEIYVGLAQRTEDPVSQVRRWMDAAHTYEQLGDATDKALEAALRALAKDMDSPTLLEEVDRFAALSSAWGRLAQVYDALARRAETPEAKIRVLLRHALLLEDKAQDPAAAFARLAIATQIDPINPDAYWEAIRVAQLASDHEGALQVRERRAATSNELDEKLEALLSACATCQRALSDTPRAMGYLARAVSLAGSDKAVLLQIEDAAKAADEKDPPLDGRGLTFALAEVLKQRAEESKRDAALSAVWLSRAAVLIEQSLGDVRGAFDVLERAASLAPGNEIVLDSLEQVAERAGTLEALAVHYQRSADDAIDGNTASISLRRLGLLLQGKLERPVDAAEVYKQLVILRPRDLDASDRLRSCLKAGGRYKDLLSAIERQLSLVTDDAQRIALLREEAEAWEVGLNNRFEALDTWRKISALLPEDESAKEAIARLEKKPVVDERSLLESTVIVLPEDLAPSIPAPEPPSEPEPEPEVNAQETAAQKEVAERDEAAPSSEASSTPTEPQSTAAAESAEPRDEHAEAEYAARSLEIDESNTGATDPAPAPVMTLPPEVEGDGPQAEVVEQQAVLIGEPSEAPEGDLFGTSESAAQELPAEERTHVSVDVAHMLAPDAGQDATSNSEAPEGAPVSSGSVSDSSAGARPRGDNTASIDVIVDASNEAVAATSVNNANNDVVEDATVANASVADTSDGVADASDGVADTSADDAADASADDAADASDDVVDDLSDDAVADLSDDVVDDEGDDVIEAGAEAPVADAASEERTPAKQPAPVVQPAPQNVLAELSNIDQREADGHDIETLDSGALELDSAQVSLDGAATAPDTLDALSSMLERGPLRTNPPARAQRIPPPPPRRPDVGARPGAGVPPPPPRSPRPTEPDGTSPPRNRPPRRG